MIFIDSNIAILKDKSIIIFLDNGEVELYGADGWKKSRNNKKSFELFQYENKETAIKIWEEVDKELKNQS